MAGLRTLAASAVRWFQSLSRNGKIITAVIALVIIGAVCSGALGAFNDGGKAPVTQATATATAKPFVCSNDNAATLGDPISAFIAKYGPSQATDPTLYSVPTDAAQDADILIKPSTGCVTDLVLSAYNATWDINQTFAQCTPFLPSGATQYPGPHPLPAQGGTFIDYNSSQGEVIMQIGAGSCELTFAH